MTQKMMQKRWGIIFGGVLAVAVLMGGFFWMRQPVSVEAEEGLLNLMELPEEFMDNYFAEYGSIESDEAKGNMLIVTAREEIAETYGATKVIAAPNSQYFLLYESESAMNKAQERLEFDETIVSIDRNELATLDDTAYNSWGIEAMALDKAIELANEENLPEVQVAVIDSGCDVELVNKYFPGKISDTYNALPGGSQVMSDSYGHGTHVAGTIAEGTPANVKIVPVKASDGRTLRISDIVTGINYVARNGKADVINMSFGIYNYNNALYNAIESARLQNIVSVAAAGNDNIVDEHYPAAYDNTISIASVDAALNKSSFSNYGPTVDFAAPGTAIKSTLSNGMALSQGSDGDDDFETLNGTSMATPHAASVVAILKSYNKDLMEADVVELLKDYAVKDLGVAGKDIYYGYGFIQLKPGSFCTDAGKNGCEEFGVFKAEAKTTIAKMEAQQVATTSRNYGTVNNLNPTQIKVSYSDGTSVMANLGDMSGAEITGYNPKEAAAQTVSVSWQGTEASFEVTNPNGWGNGWNYTLAGDEAVITGFADFNAGYATKKLYIPEEIDGYKVVEIANTSGGVAVFSEAEKASYEEIILPKTLREISGTQTFQDFTAVMRVTVLAPELRISGVFTFADDVSLREVVGTISELGMGTFINDTALAKVTLTDEIVDIPAYAFGGCLGLMEFKWPESLKMVGDYAFYGTRMKQVVLPDGVESLGDYAFAQPKNRTLSSMKLSPNLKTLGEFAFAGTLITEIELPESLETIGAYAFYATGLTSLRVPGNVGTIGEKAFAKDDEGDYITIWTDGEAYARKYAAANGVPYEATSASEVEIALEKREFKAFEMVSTEAYVYFDWGGYVDGVYQEQKGKAGRREIIKAEDVEIVYQSGQDSFRYGDTGFTVRGMTQYGSRFEKTFAAMVARLVPEYEAADYEGMYDGNEHSISISIKLESYNIRYSVGNKDYNLTELPMFKKAGEYTVYYKVSAEGYEDFEGSNTVKIYGVKEVDESVAMKDDKLVMTENGFEALTRKIQAYGTAVEYKHYDKNGELVAEDTLKTGDRIRVIVNGTQVQEYRAAVLGDVSGDGEINYMDFVSIYNHIQKAGHPESTKKLLVDEYLLAADLSGDGNISYMDYVKVYNKINEGRE